MSQQKPPDSNSQKSQSELWLVKLESEKVKGPYTTEVICKMILEGIYSGQEQVASYPQGDWRLLSKQIEFYETLLESLENPVGRDEKKAQKMDAETVIRSAPVSQHLNPDKAAQEQDNVGEVNAQFALELQKLLDADNVVVRSDNIKNQTIVNQNIGPSLADKQRQQFQIEQNKMEVQRKKMLGKLFPLFIIAVVLSVMGLVYYFSSGMTSVNAAWALVTPSLKKADVDAAEIKALKIKAITLLKNGVLDDLIGAQNLLVEAVEGQKNDMESMGLLCMVYNSMWPFTKQVSNDLKAISTVTQHARITNPLSSYSDSCQSIYLLIKGQGNDGRAVLERVLDQNTEKTFLLFPFLYLIKGEMLEETNSLVNAEAYYVEALKQFPGWARAQYNIGRVQYKQNKYLESIETFERLLSQNNQYKAALYGLGLAQDKLKNDHSGESYFAQGYAIKQMIPKEINLEALQEYANILIDQKKNKKALEVVQSALKISPSHRALKDLFISLGGESMAIEDSQITELIIEGDQFFRLGDYLAAQGRYRTAFDSDQKNSLLALKIAKSMRALNQIRESISWIDTAIKIDPKLFSAYSLKAEYLIQRYNFADAQATLMEAQKIDPNNYEILKSIARLEWKKNNLEQASMLGLKAFKQYNVDVELLTLLANINIDLYFKPKKYGIEDVDRAKAINLENAQKYSGRAIDLEPAWPESQITYAKYLFAKEGSEKSEKYYKELVKNFPYTLDYRLALGAFYEQQEKNSTAEEIYKHVIEIDPKNIKANLGMARCYKSRNDYAGAIKYYMVGSTLDPSDVEPMFSVGQLQLEMGENESKSNKASKLIYEALSRFELVKKNNPNYPKVYYFTAKAHLALGQYNEAMQDINTEKTKNPSLADPYILNAEINQKQGQYTQCAQNYSVVLKLRPTSEFYFKTAACHRLAGSLDLAEDMINEGHAKESGNYTYYRELGYLYEAKGDKEQARKNFENYLDLTAHNSFDAREIESKLGR